jgi:site-specific DNA recombinase
VVEETFDPAQQRLADNRRFASRNSKVPSLLQSLAACGYGYYRSQTHTTNKTIYYYRCLGSDNYWYPAGGSVTTSPSAPATSTRWSGITSPVCSPTPSLVRAEIDKYLDEARASDLVTGQRKRLEIPLTKASGGRPTG